MVAVDFLGRTFSGQPWPPYKIHDSPRWFWSETSRQWFAIPWFRPARTLDLNIPKCFHKFFRMWSLLVIMRCYHPGIFGSPFCRCLENLVSHDANDVWRCFLKSHFGLRKEARWQEATKLAHASLLHWPYAKAANGCKWWNVKRQREIGSAKDERSVRSQDSHALMSTLFRGHGCGSAWQAQGTIACCYPAAVELCHMYHCFDRWDVGGCIGGWPFIGTLSAYNSVSKVERVWVCSLTCCTSLPFYQLSIIHLYQVLFLNLYLALSLQLGWGSAIQACQQGLQWTLALQLLNLATRSGAAFDCHWHVLHSCGLRLGEEWPASSRYLCKNPSLVVFGLPKTSKNPFEGWEFLNAYTNRYR